MRRIELARGAAPCREGPRAQRGRRCRGARRRRAHRRRRAASRRRGASGVHRDPRQGPDRRASRQRGGDRCRRAHVGDEFQEAIAAAPARSRTSTPDRSPSRGSPPRRVAIFLGQKVTPIRRVGIYVPGGRACYPSSVLMNAIPALVAGVAEIAMVVPPACRRQRQPVTRLPRPPRPASTRSTRSAALRPSPLLAYGTETIPRVDKITGPGNAYVTAAKKLVMGDVGIDMLAGPSEVCVLADESAVPAFVAIDLMAQAEHDPARVDLPRDDRRRTARRGRRRAARAPRASRREGDITERSLADNGLVIVCPDIVAALDTVDLIAPGAPRDPDDRPVRHPRLDQQRRRHLPWARGRPRAWATTWPGPTTCCRPAALRASRARFLSTTSSRSHRCSRTPSRRSRLDGPTVTTIARAEGLYAHGRAVDLRLELVEEDLEIEAVLEPELGDQFADDLGLDEPTKVARSRWAG